MTAAELTAPGPGPGRRGRLGRNTATTSVGAAGGIVAGLLLDVSIAATFGAGRSTDALFVAMRIPIGLTAVIMAGANQSLVPMFSSWLVRKSPREYSRLVSLTLIGTLLAGSVLAGLVDLAARPLMAATAPGLPGYEVALAARLARLLFWLIPLVAGAEVLRGHMNARRRFGVPAAMNVVMNGLAAALVLTMTHHRVVMVAWAYLWGAAAQLLFMFVMSVRAGLRPTPTLALRDPELRAVLRLSGRPLAGAGLNPLARIVEQLFVSFLPPGSITILNYANRLVNAIGGTVFFRSVMVVLLPRLTTAWEHDDLAAVRRWTRSGVAIMFGLSLPLTAVMAVLGRPGAVVVFHRGRFSSAEATVLGISLAVYAASMVGQAVQRALLAPFFSKLDTGPPFRNSVYGVLANLVLIPPLVLPLEHHGDLALYGVAVAFSASQYVNVAHGWYRLHRLIGPVADRRLWGDIAATAAASAMAAVVMLAAFRVLELDAPWHRWELLGRTAVAGVAGTAVTGIVLLAWYRRGRTGPAAGDVAATAGAASTRLAAVAAGAALLVAGGATGVLAERRAPAATDPGSSVRPVAAATTGLLRPPAPWQPSSALPARRLDLAAAAAIDGGGSASLVGLRELGFRSGEVAGWRDGSRGLVAMCLRFATPGQARGYLATATRARTAGGAFRPEPVAGPAAVGPAVAGLRASAGDVHVVLFARGPLACLVGVTGGGPGGRGLTDALAGDQYRVRTS